MIIEELSSCEELVECLSGENQEHRIRKIRVFVESSGPQHLVKTYDINHDKGIQLVSFFLAWLETYGHKDNCVLGFEVVLSMLEFQDLHPKLSKLIQYSISFFVNSLLDEIREHLVEISDRADLNKTLVTNLLCLQIHPSFVKISQMISHFDFGPLMSISLDPFDVNVADSYLTVLKFLHLLPKNEQSKEGFVECMLSNINLINELCPFVLHTEYAWVLEMGFLFRRNLIYSYIPNLDQNKMRLLVIEREQLLSDSVRQILWPEELLDRDFMNGVAIMYFKEDGRGDGLLREWICSLVKEMIQVSDGVAANGRFTTPFVESGGLEPDPSRILPCPGFVLEESELHPGFFRCFGRVIALAIIHKVPVGFTFDTLLFRQLAGLTIELEHIRDASPENYRIYNNILFKWSKEEIEDLQLTFPVKFGGEADPEKGYLTDDNKEDFVRHMLHLEYEERLKDAISEIISGFDDVLTYSVRRLFFQIIRLGDLDLILRGVSNLDVQQWRSHTVYEGYTPSDLCIDWFWQCVGDMSEEEKLELFNFWTGTRWLPAGGFRELDPVLIIQMVPSTAEEKLDQRRPVAHTCFRSLSFPPYQSLEVMREHLYEIVTYYSQATFELV